MNIQQILQRRRLGSDRPVRAGLVGAGEFGATFLAQARRMPQLEGIAVCDRDLGRARAALLAAGHREDEIAECRNEAEAARAHADGKIAMVDRADLLSQLAIDVVLEATGDPEGAAATALFAIENHKHVVMVTKEAEIVVGPELARRAAENNVVHTPVDGDQPSLLIGLVEWANTLGLPVICAGKASESDFVWDPSTGQVTAWRRSVAVPEYHDAFVNSGLTLDRLLAERARAPFPRTTVPDLCEMGIVANHTGLMPDRPDLHAPIARTVELPTLFRERRLGGLLGGRGRIDMFNCLRRPDELSFAGGVFVVVEAPDAATGRLLAEKGIPTCPEKRCVLLHNPVHLLGAEAPVSALSAARLGCSTGGSDVRPRVDLVGKASRDLEPGEVLAMGTRHVVGGLEPELREARPIGEAAPLPYYLATGLKIRRHVRKGDILNGADVELASESVLLKLRLDQDRQFFK
jgi:predicted homoserine dehydrogenase-like protein